MTAIAIPPKGFPRSLRELDLWKINVSTTDWLIPLHSLERLTLACVEFNVRQIVDGGITIQYNCWQTFHKLIWEASKLQELSYFCLTGVYFDDNSTIEFPPQIRHLNLCGCCFTSKQLAGIKSLPPLLETLDLRSNRLDTIVPSILRRFWSILPPSLHTLDITNNFLQDKVVLNQRVHVLQWECLLKFHQHGQMGGCTSRIKLQDEEGVVWLVLNWYTNVEMAQETVNLNVNPPACRIAIVQVVRGVNPQ